MTVARETRATVTYGSTPTYTVCNAPFHHDGGITVMRATYNVGYGFDLYPARGKRHGKRGGYIS